MTTKFLRTDLVANGKITLKDGTVINISAVNNKMDHVKTGAVLFTDLMYPSTSKLGATIVTDTNGKVLKFIPGGQSMSVATGTYVLEIGTADAAKVQSVKVGDVIKIDNTYQIPSDQKLVAAFGNNEITMVNGIDIAKCNNFNEQIRPRTAIGWNENGDIWFATTTMGVRNSADVFNRFRVGGSTVHQLVEWLKGMGATQAVAMDGGGSTTMYAKNSDGSYTRVDLPATEWVRSVPQGIGMVAR
jgi:exopolysaccharide biosynthesis protein